MSTNCKPNVNLFFDMEKSHAWIKYPKNREIGKQLKWRDRIKIAELTGLSLGHVRNIFTGGKNNDTAVALAKRIINKREEDINNAVNSLMDNFD